MHEGKLVVCGRPYKGIVLYIYDLMTYRSMIYSSNIASSTKCRLLKSQKHVKTSATPNLVTQVHNIYPREIVEIKVGYQTAVMYIHRLVSLFMSVR
jgi:hypothetical protein